MSISTKGSLFLFFFLILSVFSLENRPSISSVQFSKDDGYLTINGLHFGNYSQVFLNQYPLECVVGSVTFNETFYGCISNFPVYRDFYYDVQIQVGDQKSIVFTFVAELSKFVRVGPGNADSLTLNAINQDPNWKAVGVCTYAGEIISQVRIVFVHNNGSKIYSTKAGWQEGGDGCTERPILGMGLTSVETWYTTHPYYGGSAFCGFRMNYENGSSYGQYYRCSATDPIYITAPSVYQANPQTRIVGVIGEYFNSGKIGFYTTAVPTLLYSPTTSVPTTVVPTTAAPTTTSVPTTVAPTTQVPTDAPVLRPYISSVIFSKEGNYITINGSNFGDLSYIVVFLNGTALNSSLILSSTSFQCIPPTPLYRDFYYDVQVGTSKAMMSNTFTFVIEPSNYVRVGPGYSDAPIDAQDAIVPNRDPNWRVTGICTQSGEIIDKLRLVLVHNNGTKMYSYPNVGQPHPPTDCIERPIPSIGLRSVETWYTTHPYYVSPPYLGSGAFCGVRLNYVNGSSYGLYYGCSATDKRYVVGPFTYQANPESRIVGTIGEFILTGKMGFYTTAPPTLLSQNGTQLPTTELPTTTMAPSSTTQLSTTAPSSTTQLPTTQVPTSAPTTNSFSTTVAPTTQVPTSAPTTTTNSFPTTVAPTTQVPTDAPTTASVPTTVAPTTATSSPSIPPSSISYSPSSSSSKPRYTTNTSPLSATISCVGNIKLEEAKASFRNLETSRFNGNNIFQVNGVELVVVPTKREVIFTKIFIVVKGDFPITSLGSLEDISKNNPNSFELSILDIQLSSSSSTFSSLTTIQVTQGSVSGGIEPLSSSSSSSSSTILSTQESASSSSNNLIESNTNSISTGETSALIGNAGKTNSSSKTQFCSLLVLVLFVFIQ